MKYLTIHLYISYIYLSFNEIYMRLRDVLFMEFPYLYNILMVL